MKEDLAETTIQSSLLDAWTSVAEACQITGLTQCQVCTNCRKGVFIAQKIGNTWVIYRPSLAGYQRRKPGLKVGQKINRRANTA